MSLNCSVKIMDLTKDQKYQTSSVKSPVSLEEPDTCDDWCQMKISSITPVISNIEYSHRGCLLSRAVMNAVIMTIQNKTVEESLKIIHAFRQMIEKSLISPDVPTTLQMFIKFSKYYSRRGCLFLGCNAIIEEISNQKSKE